jgi:hypothetical protein
MKRRAGQGPPFLFSAFGNHRTLVRWLARLIPNSTAKTCTTLHGSLGSTDEYRARIFDGDSVQFVAKINPYLVPTDTIYIKTEPNPISNLTRMVMGSMPRDGGHLIFDHASAAGLVKASPDVAHWLRKYVGSDEIISGMPRYCLWISDAEAEQARLVPQLGPHFDAVIKMRSASTLDSTN